MQTGMTRTSRTGRRRLYGKTCPVCGGQFRTEVRRRRFCDRICASASRAGISREAWLLEHGLYHGRRCHDCGEPTNDYRCPACWAKIRGEEDLGLCEDDFRGSLENVEEAWR